MAVSYFETKKGINRNVTFIMYEIDDLEFEAYRTDVKGIMKMLNLGTVKM